MSELVWNEPESIPQVALGTEELYWIAVDSGWTGKIHVFLAHYQNRPYDPDDEVAAQEDWVLVDQDGGYIGSVGWVREKEHDEFNDFYSLIRFSDYYRLLGWAEYTPPEFKGVSDRRLPHRGPSMRKEVPIYTDNEMDRYGNKSLLQGSCAGVFVGLVIGFALFG
ncbi:MAG: hypothetical protein AAF098_13430 [Pseudomonadota bacterium]